eukprot:3628151-Prorocentrum_lima.AAC.1
MHTTLHHPAKGDLPAPTRMGTASSLALALSGASCAFPQLCDLVKPGPFHSTAMPSKSSYLTVSAVGTPRGVPH